MGPRIRGGTQYCCNASLLDLFCNSTNPGLECLPCGGIGHVPEEQFRREINQEEDLTKRSALRCPRPEVKNGVPSGNKSQGTLHRTAHARPNPCEALKAPRALQGSEQSWLGRLASAAMKPASACARRYIARTLVCDHRGLKRISILGLLIYSRTCLSQPKLESAVANASEPPPAR